MRFLVIGDVVGVPGQMLFQKWIAKLKEEYRADAIIVNGENTSKNGRGINLKGVDFYLHLGVSAITSGNHIWDDKEIFNTLGERANVLLRPANYSSGCPGKGYTLFTINGIVVAVVNIIGRVFMRDSLDCPFRTMDSLLTFLRTKTSIILVDFHAEASSEKCVMGHYLDGRVSALWGTHTHVPTADERILPKGTAFISDIGFCGALDSAIGMEYKTVLDRFLFHPGMGKFKVEQRGLLALQGIVVDVDETTGKATAIQRVHVTDDTILCPKSDDTYNAY
jgi:metallophosphoesterase (TIGR00282 family)